MTFGEEFHDFAGSVVVHAVGGWIGLIAVLFLGPRTGRYGKQGQIAAHPPSSIPFLALGAWILAAGWFGFNVMSAQTIDKISGLVAVNSLMAMVGGTLLGIAVAVAGATIAYGVIKSVTRLRLDEEQEFNGADLSIHKISATPDRAQFIYAGL